jgi:hypothetical protein
MLTFIYFLLGLGIALSLAGIVLSTRSPVIPTKDEGYVEFREPVKWHRNYGLTTLAAGLFANSLATILSLQL